MNLYLMPATSLVFYPILSYPSHPQPYPKSFSSAALTAPNHHAVLRYTTLILNPSLFQKPQHNPQSPYSPPLNSLFSLSLPLILLSPLPLLLSDPTKPSILSLLVCSARKKKKKKKIPKEATQSLARSLPSSALY